MASSFARSPPSTLPAPASQPYRLATYYSSHTTESALVPCAAPRSASCTAPRVQRLVSLRVAPRVAHSRTSRAPVPSQGWWYAPAAFTPAMEAYLLPYAPAAFAPARKARIFSWSLMPSLSTPDETSTHLPPSGSHSGIIKHWGVRWGVMRVLGRHPSRRQGDVRRTRAALAAPPLRH